AILALRHCEHPVPEVLHAFLIAASGFHFRPRRRIKGRLAHNFPVYGRNSLHCERLVLLRRDGSTGGVHKDYEGDVQSEERTEETCIKFSGL
ncbi:hypothetical protein AAVH_32590, partial [Aphelenchoides avenae]